MAGSTQQNDNKSEEVGRWLFKSQHFHKKSCHHTNYRYTFIGVSTARICGDESWRKFPRHYSTDTKTTSRSWCDYSYRWPRTSPNTYYLQTLYQFYANLGSAFFQTLGNHDNVDHFPLHNENHQQPVVVGLGNWRVIMLNSAVKGKSRWSSVFGTIRKFSEFTWTICRSSCFAGLSSPSICHEIKMDWPP